MSVYDSDDARGKSPGLEQFHYDYQPVPEPAERPLTPPPNSAKSKQRPPRDNHCGESILIYFIDPNQPEIATEADRAANEADAYDDESDSEGESESASATSSRAGARAAVGSMDVRSQLTPIGHISDGASSASQAADCIRMAQSAVQLAGDRAAAFASLQPRATEVDAPVSTSPVFGAFRLTHRAGGRSQTRGANERKRMSPSQSQCGDSFDSRAKRPRDATTEGVLRSLDSARRRSFDGGGRSHHNIQDFVIPESQAPQELKLPAMNASLLGIGPLQGRSEHLPGVSQLGGDTPMVPLRQRAASSASIMTAAHNRASSVHTLLGPFERPAQRLAPATMTSAYSDPSPFSDVPSGVSPPPAGGRGGYDCHPRRVPSRPTAPPLLHNRYHSSATNTTGTTSSVERSMPSRSTSDTNVNSSTDGMTPVTHLTSPGSADHRMVQDTAHHANFPGSHPPAPVGGYRCNHDGCEAPPFATQYLLNSHTNVHSQERPHFCEIDGCPRSERGKNGEGGKGFKRKNEMVRHGLVHESPGYICPWCPDRAHKYPRPDNLQRHVRMHHNDKDKDDPRLRDILNQRFAQGSSRGRKKRG